MAAIMSMVWAVEAALGKLDDAVGRDVAAEALARRYAADIDEAAVVSTQAGQILREVAPWMDPALYNRVSALFDRIESTAVLALLGPKLLSVLTELGMTPKARAGVMGKGGGDRVGNSPVESPLARQRRKHDELQQRRMARIEAT